MYLFMKASRVVLRGVRLREEIWSIYNAKYAEMWTFYTPCVSIAVSIDFCHKMATKFTKF